MVFYFTTTGNSLYTAKQFDEKPVSIPQAIQMNLPEKNPKARYRNEHISICEIVDANNQLRRQLERRSQERLQMESQQEKNSLSRPKCG